MNTSTIAALLQVAAIFLGGLQGNPKATPAVLQPAVAIGSRAVQLAAQAEAMPRISFAIPPNDSAAPNIKDLGHAAYLDAAGNYVPLGPTVALVQEDTSFGDLNGDGFDDAAAVVERADAGGGTDLALAAMLNQGGIMFDIADLPLVSGIQVVSHAIVPGGDIVLNSSTYYLLGDQLVKIR
ncbi:MAG TPA: hypothetical protein VMT81_03695 [Candidatus Paceibacterota bacterium]|nr:hypothetical protein [Candidatus Paceibacterota bacterium]